jgi:hypothetical protein
MNYIALVLIALTLSFESSAQFGKKKKESTDKGTIFLFWGYNRSHYANSNIRFVGPGYDFTLNGVKAVDKPEPFSLNSYFNPNNITIPQFNLRVGYYYKKGWALSFGYDHMKYYLKDGNHVNLTGQIDPGVDTVTNWSGTYTGEPVVTNFKTFHYENTNGMNYIRAELMRSFDVYKPKRGSGNFGVTGNLGLSVGTILSVNDFNFAGQFNRVTYSISGYGFSAHSGVRLEFFKHLFLQADLNTGFIHQLKVRTRPEDASSFARQKVAFVEYNAVIGGLFYLKTKKKCDDCPSW